MQLNKQTTAKYGIEFMKAGFVIMAGALPVALIFNEPMLAWANLFPLAIGFMLYSTSQ